MTWTPGGRATATPSTRTPAPTQASRGSSTLIWVKAHCNCASCEYGPFILLGRDKDLNYKDDFTEGFKIFLHERGQFWPGMEMERSGQTGEILVGTGHEVRGAFTMLQKHNIDRPSAPCVQDPGKLTLCAKSLLNP